VTNQISFTSGYQVKFHKKMLEELRLKRRSVKLAPPFMAALPSTRSTPSDPPLAVTGIDLLSAISCLSVLFEGLKRFVRLPPTRVVLELREEVQRAIGETFQNAPKKVLQTAAHMGEYFRRKG
jgi:hypothetical protein